MLLWALGPGLHAVTLSQLETFDTPTGWTSSAVNPNPPVVEANVGPLGFGDSALRITSSPGSSAGSKLIAFNNSDWTGDYSGQGIHTIEMDLRNVSSLAISARIALNGPGGWWVTPAQAVVPFASWDTFQFDLTTLVAADGANSTDAAATLANVTQARILHNNSPSFRGDTGLRTLRVDNIRAVPEPSSLLLLGIFSLFSRNRKR